MAALASFLLLSLGHARNFRRRAWVGFSIVSLFIIAFWLQVRRDVAQRSSHEDLGGYEGSAFLPHSGEEVLQFDGTFSRVADFSDEQNWQKLLVSSLKAALGEGTEPVYVMFSRQGCPWCDRQLVVFHEMMQRGAGASSDSGRETVTSLVEVDGGGSLVLEPSETRPAALRLFVIDADEFPEILAEFRIQSFPTTLVFGAPGVTPSVAEGFVDDVALGSMLQEVAAQLSNSQDALVHGKQPGMSERKSFRSPSWR
jgi:thiol-disulfide isomerase/thioredoxin